MTTQGFEIDENWVDVATKITLVNDQKYTIQNTGSTLIYLAEAATEPTSLLPVHQIPSGEWGGFTPAVGTKIWVKTLAGANSKTQAAVT